MRTDPVASATRLPSAFTTSEFPTAIVRPAELVACCISWRKSLPGRKSQACSTVV